MNDTHAVRKHRKGACCHSEQSEESYVFNTLPVGDSSAKPQNDIFG